MKGTGPANKACTWLGEVYYCSFLTLLPGPAWVMLSYVLHTFFADPVQYMFVRKVEPAYMVRSFVPEKLP